MGTAVAEVEAIRKRAKARSSFRGYGPKYTGSPMKLEDGDGPWGVKIDTTSLKVGDVVFVGVVTRKGDQWFKDVRVVSVGANFCVGADLSYEPPDYEDF